MSRFGAGAGGVLGAATGGLSGLVWNEVFPNRMMTRDGTEVIGFLGAIVGAAVGAALGAGASCTTPRVGVTGVGELRSEWQL